MAHATANAHRDDRRLVRGGPPMIIRLGTAHDTSVVMYDMRTHPCIRCGVSRLDGPGDICGVGVVEGKNG